MTAVPPPSEPEPVDLPCQHPVADSDPDTGTVRCRDCDQRVYLEGLA